MDNSQGCSHLTSGSELLAYLREQLGCCPSFDSNMLPYSILLYLNLFVPSSGFIHLHTYLFLDYFQDVLTNLPVVINSAVNTGVQISFQSLFVLLNIQHLKCWVIWNILNGTLLRYFGFIGQNIISN